jgi:hypothetical protein
MPKYTVDTAFWHKGHLLPEGSSVTMTAAEAKYRNHMLTEVGAAAPAPAQAPAAPAAAAPVAGASVAEQPHDKPQHVAKHKRHRTDAANDSVN